MTPRPSIVRQCKSCPWRIDCVPDMDIPRYSCEQHQRLRGTIQSGIASLRSWRAMACHYSTEGSEFACAGWLENQRGVGNNLGVRLAMMHGELPVPQIDGPQHECFEDTL
jgi:hypothetical protein